jgi:putative transposase
MNSSDRNLSEPFFFVIAAVGGWKHLFANEACARIVFDSLDHLRRTRKLALYAFVLLPSHLNLLCRPLGGEIHRTIGGFADFTAARMISILRRRGRGPLMHYLHARSKEAAPGAPIWGDLRIQEVLTREKLRSVLDLMHNKPLHPEWRLAETRAEYLYSSACFYDLGREPIIPVLDARAEMGG